MIKGLIIRGLIIKEARYGDGSIPHQPAIHIP